MAEYLGYAALLVSLMATTINNQITFRRLHLLASCIYFAYGISIEAFPLVIGAVLFIIIHCYHLNKTH